MKIKSLLAAAVIACGTFLYAAPEAKAPAISNAPAAGQALPGSAVTKAAPASENSEAKAPQKKAGGSLATVAYSRFSSPVVVEEIKADAGMDIGDTFIGMHLKKVAVPVRLSVKQIGEAHLTCARVRPKFIGGIRAIYNEDLL